MFYHEGEPKRANKGNLRDQYYFQDPGVCVFSPAVPIFQINWATLHPGMTIHIVQIPTRIPEKIVVALFSGIVVNSGILVEAGRLHTI